VKNVGKRKVGEHHSKDGKFIRREPLEGVYFKNFPVGNQRSEFSEHFLINNLI
jgi:hypothetical protein